MPQRPTTDQLELFSSQRDAEAAQMPLWQALPEETRLRLTKMMVRLILEHIDGERTPRQQETRHDG